MRAIGRRSVAVAADVADDDAPERIVEAALGLGGCIDVLVILPRHSVAVGCALGGRPAAVSG